MLFFIVQPLLRLVTKCRLQWTPRYTALEYQTSRRACHSRTLPLDRKVQDATMMIVWCSDSLSSFILTPSYPVWYTMGGEEGLHLVTVWELDIVKWFWCSKRVYFSPSWLCFLRHPGFYYLARHLNSNWERQRGSEIHTCSLCSTLYSSLYCFCSFTVLIVVFAATFAISLISWHLKLCSLDLYSLVIYWFLKICHLWLFFWWWFCFWRWRWEKPWKQIDQQAEET